MSSEFARKKKLERPIYIRNIDGTFNHKRPIEYTVEMKSFYRGHKERTEINMIGDQKCSIILEIPQLIYYNPEINWKTGKVKIMRCSDKCGKQ